MHQVENRITFTQNSIINQFYFIQKEKKKKLLMFNAKTLTCSPQKKGWYWVKKLCALPRTCYYKSSNICSEQEKNSYLTDN